MWVSLECLGCGLVRLSLDDGVQHYGVVSEAPRTVTILVRPTPPPTSANIFAWSLIDFFHCACICSSAAFLVSGSVCFHSAMTEAGARYVTRNFFMSSSGSHDFSALGLCDCDSFTAWEI